MRLEIDNWRWSGVPFFIRTGKRLPVTQTEFRLVFERPPRLGFAPRPRRPEPTSSRPAGPAPGAAHARRPARRLRGPGADPPRHEFAQEGSEGPTPYEVPLHAAMAARARFPRQDVVEEAWRVMQPLLGAPPPVHRYAKGSWGPSEARRAPCPLRALHTPWVGAG